jgi:uncharacterized LabA/DUF88 family protein
MNRNRKIETSSRIGIFIDIQNMFFAAKNLYKSKIDYDKLLTFLADDRDVIIATSYLIFKEDSASDKFEIALKKTGFDIKKKNMEFRKKNDREINVTSWDVGISVDMVKWMHKLDTIILVSSSGAFVDVIEYLKNFVRIEVASFSECTSGKLKYLANEFIDLSPKPNQKETLLMDNIDNKPEGLPEEEELETQILESK